LPGLSYAYRTGNYFCVTWAGSRHLLQLIPYVRRHITYLGQDALQLFKGGAFCTRLDPRPFAHAFVEERSDRCSQIHRFTRSVIGDRPSHPIYKVPPSQGLLDEIRQFRMPKVRFHRRQSHFAGVLRGYIETVLGEPPWYRRANKNQAISAQPSERARKGARRALQFPKEMKRHRW